MAPPRIQLQCIAMHFLSWRDNRRSRPPVRAEQLMLPAPTDACKHFGAASLRVCSQSFHCFKRDRLGRTLRHATQLGSSHSGNCTAIDAPNKAPAVAPRAPTCKARTVGWRLSQSALATMHMQAALCLFSGVAAYFAAKVGRDLRFQQMQAEPPFTATAMRG